MTADQFRFMLRDGAMNTTFARHAMEEQWQAAWRAHEQWRQKDARARLVARIEAVEETLAELAGGSP